MSLLLISVAATGLLLWRARSTGFGERWSADGAAVAAFVAATVLFFWQFWLLPGTAVPRGGGDLVSFLYPTYRFAADALWAGHFPFWNPHLFGGAPFAADVQSGVYYPPNLLAFWAVRPFSYEALETLAVLHYPLAATAAYALARELEMPRLGAFGAGLAFAFGGFMVAHLGHYNMLAAAAWAPLVLALLLRAVRTGELRWSALSAGAFGMVLLPGHTQTALYTALAASLIWLGTLWRSRPIRRHTAALPVTLGLGAAAAAVQLLPAWELSRLSIRAEIAYQQAAQFAASPLGFVTFLVPGFFGDSPVDYWGLRWSLQESYGYVGISGLALAALALATAAAGARSGRVGVPLAAAVALFGLFWLFLSLGESTPLHGWLYRLVPGFDKVRAPGRALLFVDLAAAILIGLAIVRIQRPLSWRERPAVGRTLRLLALLLAAGALVAMPLFLHAALTSQDKDPTILRRVLAATTSLSLTLMLLALTLWFLWRWSRRARGWVPAAMVALLWLDLASANAGFNPTTEDLLAGYRHDPIVAWLRERVGTARIDVRTGVADLWQPNLAQLADLEDVGGLFNPLMLRSFERYWEGLGSRSVPGYDLLAVRYVVARADAPLDPAKFRRVFESGALGVFENAAALPRAFVVPRAERADEPAIQARLRDPAFDPRAVVLLEEGTPELPAGGGAVAEIVRPGPNEVILRLAEGTTGYVVLADVHYPGWRAYVDGAEAPILRAYGLFRAVPVGLPAREVRLQFRPSNWPLALGISALAWTVIGIFAAAPVVRRFGLPRRRLAMAWR